MALSGQMQASIADAAGLMLVVHMMEHHRAHKVETKRFNRMQGYADRGLPVPHFADLLL